MNKSTILCFALLTGGFAFAQNNTPVEQIDTLRREMVLEREYVPTTEQATKKFFNPLDSQRSTQLKPLSFANTTYGVSMNIHPRLFEPVYESKAIVPKQNTWHARLFGGYPTRFGINTGLLFKAGENGTVDLAIDHQSQKDLTTHERLTFKPVNTTHDTDFTLRYGHKLPDRLFNVSVGVYNNMQTYFGHYIPATASGEKSPLQAIDYPLYQMIGGDISFDISPAPLVLRSPWQYSVFGNVGYGRQDLPLSASEVEKATASGLDLLVGGNLAYGISTYDFNFGADVLFKSSTVSSKRAAPEAGTMPMVLSVTPYASYINESFTLKAGANLQLLNGAGPRFHVSPDITARWKATDDFSIFAEVDGGGNVTGFRDLYKLNRYSLPTSISNAMTVANYDAAVGLQVGSISGFSADIRGGYAGYNSFFDWSHNALSQDAQRMGELPFTTFAPRRLENVHHAYFTASARYLYPEGLEIAGGIRYNRYILPRSQDSDREIHPDGLPSLILNLSADYQVLPNLTAHLNLQGMGGISYTVGTLEAPDTEKLPFLTDLSARVSYKVHKNVGLSIMGTNLLNQRQSRWIHYTRPGIGVLGAVTINL